MSTAVAKTGKPATEKPKAAKRELKEWLESDSFKAQIAAVLPKHLTPDRMIRTAITATMRSPDLLKCDQASFFNQMLVLSQFGLEPDGRRAHLIPFWNSTRGCYECQLILDYKGVVELILRTGNVSAIHADKVCENDDFEYDCGQVVLHRIDFKKPRGDAYAYYCIITRKDGTCKCEVMSLDEVKQIRARSKAGNSGPWVTDFDEMAKKTVFKRASKWVELSSEIRDLVDADNDLTIDANVVSPPKIESVPRGNDGLRARLLGDSGTATEELPGSDSEADQEPHPSDVADAQVEAIKKGLQDKINKTASVQGLQALRREVMDSSLAIQDKNELLDGIDERIAIVEES